MTKDSKTAQQTPDPPPREHGDINRLFADQTARSARDGDVEAARDVLEEFVGTMDQFNATLWEAVNCKPFHYEHVRFIADAFEQILAALKLRETKGMSDKAFCSRVALALGIKSSRPGRRKGRAATYKLDALGAAYWFLVRRGYKGERAIVLLHDGTGATRRTIQEASRGVEAYQFPELIDEEIVRAGFAPYAGVVGEILRKHHPPLPAKNRARKRT